MLLFFKATTYMKLKIIVFVICGLVILTACIKKGEKRRG